MNTNIFRMKYVIMRGSIYLSKDNRFDTLRLDNARVFDSLSEAEKALGGKGDKVVNVNCILD